MTTARRLHALMIVRRAAERMASADYARAWSAAGRQHDVAARLAIAADSVVDASGTLAGGDLAAQFEFAERLRAARLAVAQTVSGANQRCAETASVRAAARQTLDHLIKRQEGAARERETLRERTMPQSRGSK